MTDKSLVRDKLKGNRLKLQSMGPFLMLPPRSHSRLRVVVGVKLDITNQTPAIKQCGTNPINAEAEIAIATKPMDIDPSTFPRFNQGGDYGIVTERDIVYRVTAQAADPTEVVVCEIMRKPCIWVEPHLTLPELGRRFEETGIQRAPVMQKGRLLGIVSITDIIMKSNLKSVVVPDNFSQRIETALRHKRLSWNKYGQIQQECETAWDVLKELQSQDRDHSDTVQN